MAARLGSRSIVIQSGYQIRIVFPTYFRNGVRRKQGSIASELIQASTLHMLQYPFFSDVPTHNSPARILQSVTSRRLPSSDGEAVLKGDHPRSSKYLTLTAFDEYSRAVPTGATSLLPLLADPVVAVLGQEAGSAPSVLRFCSGAYARTTGTY
ncbi:hypothetical protein BC826DRAFT_158550 [Russula brevipes]|nr:hypothetical protein BC826DRAFT_158550 [Russula brevipes]